MKDFNYYKNWALDHLKKQLKKEKTVVKSLEFCELILEKSFPVGTIREWKGKKYRKMPNGKWQRYFDKSGRGTNQAIRNVMRQIEALEENDVQGLINIIQHNSLRFRDGNGILLPEVQELYELSQKKQNNWDEINKEREKTKNVELQLADFPAAFNKGKWKKQTQIFMGYINNLNGDPQIKKILKSLNKVFNFSLDFKISKPLKKDKYIECFTYSYMPDTGKPVSQALRIEDNMEDITFRKSSCARLIHELTHMIDFNVRKNKNHYSSYSEDMEDLHNAIEKAKVSNEERDRICSYRENKLNEIQMYLDTGKAIKKRQLEMRNEFNKGTLSREDYYEQNDELNQKINELNANIKRVNINEYIAENQLTDIYDALLTGELYAKGFPGHGKKYYSEKGNKAKEILANIASLSIIKPEYVHQLEKDQPELMKYVHQFFDEVEAIGDKKK